MSQILRVGRALSSGRGAGENLARLVPSFLLVLLALLLYAGSLDEFFYKDDFALLRRARDGGLLELVTVRLADHLQGENEWGHWRPGWWVVNELAHHAFGADPLGYRLGAVLFHVLLALCVQAVVVRWTRNVLAGFLAGLLLIVMPAPVEAVAWMAAATNVLPAALLVGASGIAWLVHLRSGTLRSAAAALVCLALSLFFREAAYHLPLLFVSGWLVVRGVPRDARELARCAVPAALGLAVVVFHFVWLVPAAPTPPLAELPGRIAANLGDCLRLFAPFAAGSLPASVLALALLSALLVLGGRRARYFLVWAALATFPYIATEGYASRFAYFPAVPLAIGLALGAHGLGLRAGRAAGALATACLAAFTFASAMSFSGAMEPYLEHARVSRGFLDDCRDQGLARYERVCVDALPWELVNGVEPMLELYLGKPIEVENAALAPRPPFVVHVRPIPDEAPEQAFLAVSAGRARLCSRAQLLRGATPIRLVSFPRDWQVVEDREDALALVAAGATDLERMVLLGAAPALALAGEPGTAATALRAIDWSPGRFELEVTAPEDSLLVLAWEGKGEARATIDGRPARILVANGVFQALELPAGSERVVWEGKLLRASRDALASERLASAVRAEDPVAARSTR